MILEPYSETDVATEEFVKVPITPEIPDLPVLDLTSSDWVQLLDGCSDDSALTACCPSVVKLRDVLTSILQQGGRTRPLSAEEVESLQTSITRVEAAHELSPIMQKVCKQIGYVRSETAFAEYVRERENIRQERLFVMQATLETLRSLNHT